MTKFTLSNNLLHCLANLYFGLIVCSYLTFQSFHHKSRASLRTKLAIPFTIFIPVALWQKKFRQDTGSIFLPKEESKAWINDTCESCFTGHRKPCHTTNGQPARSPPLSLEAKVEAKKSVSESREVGSNVENCLGFHQVSISWRASFPYLTNIYM